MKLQVHVEEMLKSLPCYATYRALADIGKNRVQKLAEQGSAYSSRAVYREVNVVDCARGDEESDGHPSTRLPASTHTVEWAVISTFNESTTPLNSNGT